MSNFYLYLLSAICIGLLFWGMTKAEKVYQYPFFMGAIFTTFLLPQAFALASNPGNSVSEIALSRVLLMSCLCAAMCWVGYQINPNQQWLNKVNITTNKSRLFKIGIVFLVVSYVFRILLWNTKIEIASNSNWTGSSTIYVFFSQIIYIALAIFLLESLERPSVSNFLLTSLAIIIPIQTILIGRRQATVTFFIIIGLCFWFAKKYIPPRILVISLVILGLYLIPLLGKIRGDTWNLAAQQDWQTLTSTSEESLETVLEGDILELRNAALVMDATAKTGQYGYGTGYWDNLVFQYVPGQILGHDFKSSLQFKRGARRLHLAYFYGYSIPLGSTDTGIGDAFREFDYFGCLFFALMGVIFKHLWISANYYQSKFSMLLYIGLISPAMVAITHGTGRFLQEALFQLIFVGIAIYFSKEKTTESFIKPAKARLKSLK